MYNCKVAGRLVSFLVMYKEIVSSMESHYILSIEKDKEISDMKFKQMYKQLLYEGKAFWDTCQKSWWLPIMSTVKKR